MSIFDNIKLRREKRGRVSDEQIINEFHGLFEEPWTGLPAPDRNTALGLPIVWACTRVLSETLASLPLILYKRLPDGGKERAVDHPLYDLLHNKPNKYQSAFQFKEQMESHLCIYGNAYAQIVTDGRGYPIELNPMDPSNMRIGVEGGEIVYFYFDDISGREVKYPRGKIFHVAGFGFDGVQGYCPLSLNSQTFSLSIAAKKYSAEFYKNDGTPNFIITHPNKLSPIAYDRLKKNWEENHQKWGKKHSALILEEGMNTKETQLSPDKAQFLETQKFLIIEICRIYRIQPHIVQDLERSTNNNIEHQGLEFVTYTMHPWCVRWEQAITTQLLSEKDRREYFSEFLVDALLRGDVVSRWQAYRTAIETGVMNQNEVRERENMNKRERGDIYRVPANWIPDDGSVPAQPNGVVNAPST